MVVNSHYRDVLETNAWILGLLLPSYQAWHKNKNGDLICRAIMAILAAFQAKILRKSGNSSLCWLRRSLRSEKDSRLRFRPQLCEVEIWLHQALSHARNRQDTMSWEIIRKPQKVPPIFHLTSRVDRHWGRCALQVVPYWPCWIWILD